MQNIRIITYLFGLLTIIIFEEPRVSQLLTLVFPGEFSKLFSYSLPVLVLLISVVTYSQGYVGRGRTAVFAFSVVLFLSYGNTVLISVREAQAEHDKKIQSAQGRLDNLQIQMNSGKSARQCWAPNPAAENYQDLLNGYNGCLAQSAVESEGIKQTVNSLSAQIKIQTAAMDSLQKSIPDYWKSATQASVGILLSVILGIGTAVFCLGLASEIREFASTSTQSETAKIAGYLAEGHSIREIAQKLGTSKSSAERAVREFRTVQSKIGVGNSRNLSGTPVGQSWDTSGTVWDSPGTPAGQTKKRPKTEGQEEKSGESIFDRILDSDFGGFAPVGRMA